jgi:hypothetical protein
MSVTRRFVCAGLVATTIVTGGASRAASPEQTPAAIGPAPATAMIDRAYTTAYNLDHDEAVALARQAIALNPGDPNAHRALAAILMLNILFRRGAVTVDHFMGGVAKSLGTLPKPQPELDAEPLRADTAIHRGSQPAASPKDIDGHAPDRARFAGVARPRSKPARLRRQGFARRARRRGIRARA